MSSPGPEPDSMSPETARLLLRITIGLGVFAGALALIAFVLGVVREDVARWPILVLAVLFMGSPTVIRRVLNPR